MITPTAANARSIRAEPNRPDVRYDFLGSESGKRQRVFSLGRGDSFPSLAPNFRIAICVGCLGQFDGKYISRCVRDLRGKARFQGLDTRVGAARKALTTEGPGTDFLRDP